jgi:hypothetical protein
MQSTVEDCLPLDANLLAKSGMFGSGDRSLGKGMSSASIIWSNGSSISLSYRQPDLHLSFCRDGEPVQQTINVESSPCNFGGWRHYFTCPGCRNRRYKLRLGGSGFYCRQCYRLPYYSQECCDLDGLIHQKHKLEAKLVSSCEPRMRTTTRMKLNDQLRVLEAKIDRAMVDRYGAAAMAELGVFV